MTEPLLTTGFVLQDLTGWLPTVLQLNSWVSILPNVGYLNFCSQTGAGTADLNKIQIIGESINYHKKSYKLSDNFKDQLIWMNPVSQNIYRILIIQISDYLIPE